MLNVGDKAPGFTLTDQFGKSVSLSDYDNKWLLVWWIPSTMAEMTPMCCDAIATHFGEQVREHPELNVVGLSFDTREQMRVFAQRAAANFPLLADTTREVGAAYGVLRDDEWDCFPKKRSFLVNPEGNVVKVYSNIDPDLHVAEVVEDMDTLGAFPAPKRSLLSRLVGR